VSEWINAKEQKPVDGEVVLFVVHGCRVQLGQRRRGCDSPHDQRRWHCDAGTYADSEVSWWQKVTTWPPSSPAAPERGSGGVPTSITGDPID
jgi:hypothetical protein